MSERSFIDSQAPMGYGATRTLERVLAACGCLSSAGLAFVCAEDVPQGGVLCALAALLTEGLLRHTRSFYTLPPGFYDIRELDPARLAADPQALRFMIVFDREGFSPKLFAELQEQRIGVLTYHKDPGERWPDQEFSSHSVRLHAGEVV